MFTDWTTLSLRQLINQLAHDVRQYARAWDRAYLTLALTELEQREEISYARS